MKCKSKKKIMLTAFWDICPENKIAIFATQLLKKTNMNILRNIMTGALLLTAPAIMRAQTDGTRTEIDPLVISADDSTALAADIPLADGAVTSLRPLSGIRATDMFLPVCDLSAPGFDGLSPWNCGFYGSDWRLHQGFNAQLSMSLTAGFGKGAPHGVGFGQNAAFAYALPLSKRFSAAVGVYANNMDWGGYHQTDGGVAAAVKFKATERFSLYAYGAKSFLPKENRLHRGLLSPFFAMPKDRVGVMGEVKVGEKAMIRVSVERQSY